MKILHVCGARPNFMKIAAVVDALANYPHIQSVIVHTGQHYDKNMSGLFFEALGLPEPDVNLEVGSGTHAVQTGEIMKRFEPVLQQDLPDAVVVVGDVNSTIACSLVAVKLQVPVIHVEAGLRSFDRGMPEEINRLLTDAISSVLFVSEPAGEVNLRSEGIELTRIYHVGNVMIDTLLKHRERARSSQIHAQLAVRPGRYGVITLHRPHNVDNGAVFSDIVDAFKRIQQDLPLVFCMHPRTRQAAERCGVDKTLAAMDNLQVIEPLGYLDFLHLMSEASILLTDSGGIQEEATILRVPCLTLRHNTERPITLTHGTNVLAGTSSSSIMSAYDQVPAIRNRQHIQPPLWDGQAGQRIAATLNSLFS